MYKADILLKKGQVVISSAGDDPRLETERLSLTSNNSYFLVVKISFPACVFTQLFFKRPNHGYEERDSAKIKVSEAENSVIMELPCSESLERIRFDPGTFKGDYIMHRFCIKAVPPFAVNTEMRSSYRHE